MEKIKRFLKKRWATVLLALCLIAAGTMIVSAEYIKDRNREKRVVANMGASGKRFSSDRLTSVTPITAFDVPFPTSGDQPCEIEFSIFNYSLAEIANYYPNPIYFQVKAKLVDRNGSTIDPSLFEASSFGIKENTETSYSFFTAYDQIITINGNFAGTESDGTHKYKICFPRSMTAVADKVYIELEAKPYSDSAHINPITELDTLHARISVAAQSSVDISKGWTGSFLDTMYYDLDAFNFVFAGSGEAKLVFCYNNTKFEVNKFFLDEIETNPKYTIENGCYYRYDPEQSEGETPQVWKKYTDPSWNTIIINPTSGDTRFDLQLYMNNPDQSYYMNSALTGIDWSKINGYVKYNPDAPQSATAGN